MQLRRRLLISYLFLKASGTNTLQRSAAKEANLEGSKELVRDCHLEPPRIYSSYAPKAITGINLGLRGPKELYRKLEQEEMC
jgi:hypothetical protein